MVGLLKSPCRYHFRGCIDVELDVDGNKVIAYVTIIL